MQLSCSWVIDLLCNRKDVACELTPVLLGVQALRRTETQTSAIHLCTKANIGWCLKQYIVLSVNIKNNSIFMYPRAKTSTSEALKFTFCTTRATESAGHSGKMWLRSISKSLKCIMCHSFLTKVTHCVVCNDSRGLSPRFEHATMGVKWRKETYEWTGRRERGKRCEPHPAWTNMKRHSEGHGCLWKCLCELRQGKKNIWGAFSVWHLKTAGWESQWLVSPCINLLTPVRGLTARGAFVQSSPVWFSTVWSDVCDESSHRGHGDRKLYSKNSD